MPTRYRQLRQIVARLAASADEQHAYLESILAKVSGLRTSWGYGNDELALELEDIFLAAGDMHAWGEITDEEIAAIRPLDDLLLSLSGEQFPEFWRREGLWQDPRWEEVRACARRALDALPDEERDTGWLETVPDSRNREGQ